MDLLLVFVTCVPLGCFPLFSTLTTFHHLPQASPIQPFHSFSAYMKLHACVHGSHAKVTRPPPLQPVQLFPHRRRPLKTLYPTRPLQELDGCGIVSDTRGEFSPRRPGSTEAIPHALVKAAAAGSPPGCRRWNTAANTVQLGMSEVAREVGSLDQLRGPPATSLSPPLSPS